MSFHRYVALLRAINVGGNNLMKMADLRSAVEGMDLSGISTHIQTGNLLFGSDQSKGDVIARKLEQQLAKALGYRGMVFVLSLEELERAVSRNPFEPELRQKDQICHLMFLSEAPDMAHTQALLSRQGEEYQFRVDGRVLYFAYSREAAGQRRNLNFEKILGVAGTARSWKVVTKLISLLTEMSES